MIKPCPFCGNPPSEPDQFGYVECTTGVYDDNDTCGCHTGVFTVEQWNTRPIEDKLRQRIAELENQLKESE